MVCANHASVIMKCILIIVAIIYIEHRFPFSLMTEMKRQFAGKSLSQTGDVAELMDRGIGRPVIRIKGAVSANNFVEFDHLHLIGHVLYIELCLQNPMVATFHVELCTTTNTTLRLSFSTLYDGDQPRFLGRSVRYVLLAPRRHNKFTDFALLWIMH
jgi:hypothetical protein